jgi:hypothetical protein
MRSRFSRTLLIVAAATLAPGALLASGLSFDTLVKLGLELDSNPQRLSGEGHETDVVERLFLDVDVRSTDPGQAIGGSLRLGAKRFEGTDDEDALVVDLTGVYQRRFSDTFGLSLRFAARDRTERGHVRDYLRLGLRAALVARTDDVVLSAGPSVGHFIYKPNGDLSYLSTGMFTTLAWHPLDELDITTTYSYGVRGYSQRQLANDLAGLRFAVDQAREDDVHTLGTTFGLRGNFIASLSIFWQRNLSNSYGKGLSRLIARFSGTFSLPLDLFLTTQASIQRTEFDDDFLIDPLTSVDDENRNSLVLSFSRDLTDWLQAEVRYSLFLQEFGGDDIDYERHLLYGGLITVLGD